MYVRYRPMHRFFSLDAMNDGPIEYFSVFLTERLFHVECVYSKLSHFPFLTTIQIVGALDELIFI